MKDKGLKLTERIQGLSITLLPINSKRLNYLYNLEQGLNAGVVI